MQTFKYLPNVGMIRKYQLSLMEEEPCLLSVTMLALYNQRIIGIKINSSYPKGSGASQTMF